MTNPLVESSILLHVEIRQWSGMVTDNNALNAVAKTYAADTHRDKYSKSLFVTDALSDVRLNAGRARTNLYYHTVPWLDNGEGRLIPAERFREFGKAHALIKHAFYKSVEDFLLEYPDHKERARQHKGQLFHEGEYPSVDVLRSLFAINLNVLPFPNVEDVRIKASDELIAELKTSMNASMDAVASVVNNQVRMRFDERISMLENALVNGKRFNKSLLTKLEDVVAFGESLGTTIVPALRNKLDVTRQHILPLDGAKLRNSQQLQLDVVTLCRSLLI